eukprot:COSAG02_NODE_18847_length_914_cov_1.350920_1_plen_127_part_10
MASQYGQRRVHDVFGSADGYCLGRRCAPTPKSRNVAVQQLYTKWILTRVWFAGWTSGKLAEAGGCGLIAEEEADAWIFSIALLFFMTAYFVCGVVIKKLQGRSDPSDWLPNHHFCSSLYGLVVDGVA